VASGRLLCNALLAAIFVAAATPSHPQAGDVAANTLDWDCWVSTTEPIAIRCIVARETRVSGTDEDELQAALLEHIHSLIHARRTQEIDGVLLSNLQVLGEESVWSIFIWNQPFDTSWLEDRPRNVVRIALCPPDYACNVFLERP